MNQKVTEDQIGENFRFLKKQQWFQPYLVDDQARHLIINDAKVRNLIGQCRIKRMNGSFYEQRYENRFRRLIQSKLNI